MKKSELRKILKPLIKECIKEVVFEEGVLASLISEVISGTSKLGMAAPTSIVEDLTVKQEEEQEEERQSAVREKIIETKKKMLDAIGNESYNGVNLFEGTNPLRSSGAKSDSPSASPLGAYAPEDPGVDISSIFSSRWKKLV